LRAGCDLLCLGTENTDAQLADIERAVGSAVADGTLGANRVREATSRVRGLAAELEAARQAAGEPQSSAPGWPTSAAELVDAFDVQPGAADWRARARGRYTVVRFEADPNIAVGTTPWGPFAAAAAAPAEPAAAAFAKLPVCLISPERSALPPFQPSRPVLVIGRDIHQHPFAREAVDRLRSQDVDLLVVDMGWPSADRRYSDVATFGASRLMGRALLSWLAPWD
jgi:beta-N-acetylhexosaminidase